VIRPPTFRGLAARQEGREANGGQGLQPFPQEGVPSRGRARHRRSAEPFSIPLGQRNWQESHHARRVRRHQQRPALSRPAKRAGSALSEDEKKIWASLSRRYSQLSSQLASKTRRRLLQVWRSETATSLAALDGSNESNDKERELQQKYVWFLVQSKRFLAAQLFDVWRRKLELNRLLQGQCEHATTRRKKQAFRSWQTLSRDRANVALWKRETNTRRKQLFWDRWSSVLQQHSNLTRSAEAFKILREVRCGCVRASCISLSPFPPCAFFLLFLLLLLPTHLFSLLFFLDLSASFFSVSNE